MTRRWRRFMRVGAMTIVSATAGLAVRAQIPVPTDAGNRNALQANARDISGTWQGTFQLDSAWQLPQRASSRSVPARIHFAPVGDATATTSSARSVNPGTFEIDFARFGFTLSTQEALGWSVTADSMRAVLNPTVDRGLVEVHGTFRGDTIVGTWRYASDPGGATGTF